MHIPRWFHPLAALVLSGGPSLPAQAGPPALQPAYRGGALVVTDPGLAQGHLAPGQILPIRLSRLTPPAGPGLPPLQGAETPGSVRWGELAFLQVSPACVRFTASFGATARTFTLRQGESADLDGDGLPDLALQAPAKALSTGAGAVDYALLAFACDGAHTALFALAPEAFPGGRYPYGISGATPSGQFIFQSDCLPLRPVAASGPGVAAFAFEADAGPGSLVQPAPGDVLVEAGTGRFGRIGAVRPRPGGLEIRYSAAASPFLFQEVFGAACIRISGSLAELGRRYRCGPVRSWDAGADLVDIDLVRPLMDDADGRLELQLRARLRATLSLGASINYYGLSANLAAYLDESLRLAAAYQARRPCRQSYGPLDLGGLEAGFAVYGVPVSFGMALSAGLDLAGPDAGDLLEGFSAAGRWGWSAAFAASWGWSGVEVNAPAPVLTDTLAVQALPENQVRLAGAATVRPWLSFTPRVGMASLLYGECGNTLAAVGSVRSGAEAGALHAQLDVSYQLTPGFGLELPLLGRVWRQSWPQTVWSETVWSRDFRSSAARVP